MKKIVVKMKINVLIAAKEKKRRSLISHPNLIYNYWVAYAYKMGVKLTFEYRLEGELQMEKILFNYDISVMILFSK